METKLFDREGKEVGVVKLADDIFNQQINKVLLWENVTALLKNQRKGTACTKSRAEVRGGGKKPYRQKGIGWARHGSIRSPIWRGGGVTFGPKPRDYRVNIPKKKKFKALLSSLSAKAKEERIKIITELTVDSPKTKEIAGILKKFNLEQAKTLLSTEKIDNNLKLACRNIPNLTLKRVNEINCLDILSADYLLMTKNALQELEKRCATKK
ncbi:MAG TPA: 50S ribosomal protein L4 [candidate division WOR-3 bacterium]|uniref:Large ribosomal subunit protein uL4 n=1 Tax=candidate division WOR-3 bacterium TaxID=2052148 RepID=A0A9C9EKX6_UNCW3|nr:50S ribosomal protein L4 [candidate division WOR-3 bacterium]